MSHVVQESPEAWRAANWPWETARDEETGAAIPRPPEWEEFHTPEARIVLRAPVPPGYFAWNVALTVERPPSELAEISAYSSAMIGTMALTMTDLYVIGIDTIELYELEGRRVLSAHRSGPYGLALEQFWFLKDGIATIFSGTCEATDHDEFTNKFSQLVQGMSLATRLPGEQN